MYTSAIYKCTNKRLKTHKIVEVPACTAGNATEDIQLVNFCFGVAICTPNAKS